MKKRIPAILSIFLAMVLVLTSCGGSGSSSDSMMSTAQSAAAEAPEAAESFRGGMYMATDGAADLATEEMSPEENSSLADPQTPDQERKIIKNCWMQLETTTFDSALSTMNQLIEDAGGYVESQSVSGRSLNNYGDYYERSASVTARVPADKLDEVTTALGDTFNIVSQEESIEDITDSYYDAQTRLENMQVQEQRLVELLAQAESLEDIITLESALADVRTEIESLTGRLRRMDNQVAYSTLTMNIQEVVELTQIQQKPKTFVEKLGESFRRSGQNITSTLQGLIFFLVEEGPVLLIWVALIALVVWLIRKLVRRLQRNRPPRQPFSLVPPPGGPGTPSPTSPTVSSPTSKPEKEKRSDN